MFHGQFLVSRPVYDVMHHAPIKRNLLYVASIEPWYSEGGQGKTRLET